MIVKAITEKLSDSDKRLAAAFLRLRIIPEHATPNKVNYTGEKDSGCYSIVKQSTNTRFQGGSSKYPGVKWFKRDKKWKVEIRSFPGEKVVLNTAGILTASATRSSVLSKCGTRATPMRSTRPIAAPSSSTTRRACSLLTSKCSSPSLPSPSFFALVCSTRL